MLRLALALPILAGCQLVFELEEPVAVPCLVDEFEGDAVASHWRQTRPVNTTEISVGNDLLHLPLPANADDYGELESATVFDLATGSMEIEIAQVPYQGPNAPGNVEFGIYVQDFENYSMVATSGDLVLIYLAELGNPESRDDVVVTFDPNSDAHWAIRFRDGNVVWETSPDGEVWATRREIAAPGTRSEAFLGLYVASYSNGVANPGEAAVERVVVDGNCVASP